MKFDVCILGCFARSRLTNHDHDLIFIELEWKISALLWIIYGGFAKRREGDSYNEQNSTALLISKITVGHTISRNSSICPYTGSFLRVSRMVLY